MNIVQYFLAFILYSFIGWMYETAIYTIQEKRFISSGFLKGPWCPLYGGGAVLMVFCFFDRTDSILVTFFGGMAVATIVEYLTAVVLENVFHKKWWDYSNIKFNYKSRICLLGAVCFGTLCLLLCKVIHPLFVDLISLVPQNVQFWLAVILVIVFAVDCLMTILFFRKNKSTGKEENYENQLPPLDLQTLFGNIGDKIRIRFGK
ncbi:MAG: putative ABC transporter permease [Ruminococcus sp.]|nr:putative ABC transporter permease [Ruminococcus sp.]